MCPQANFQVAAAFFFLIYISSISEDNREIGMTVFTISEERKK